MCGLHCCTGFSLAAVSRGCTLVAMCRLLIEVAPLTVEQGSLSCGAGAPLTLERGLLACGAGAQQLWRMCLVALQQVMSSQLKD